ncbi:MAG: TonB-dependent receptor plug domain-containing protein [Bacteroidota bacterium]
MILITLCIASKAYNQVSFESELNRIEAEYKISFSYADDIITGLKCEPLTLVDLRTDLARLSELSGFRFSLPKEGIVTIKAVSRDYCLNIFDNESKEGLPGVQLIINNKPTNTISDGSGELLFSTKTSLLTSISLRFIGYNKKSIRLSNLNTTDCNTTLLEISTKTLDEVVVNYLSSGISASMDEHSLQIDSKSLALLPGETDGDVFLALKSLPGISSPNGKAGNLHVRGSTTDQTLVLFDDIPIYHKGHYFGAISPYNPWAIENINVYRSGFGAEIGGRVGGAITMKSSQKIPERATYKLGLNTYYGSAFVKIPVSPRIAVQGAIRSTYTPSWNSPKLEAINTMVFEPSITSLAENDPNLEVRQDDFSFRDINLSGTIDLDNHQLFVSVLDISNDQDVEIEEQNGTLQDRIYDLVNRGINLKWQASWNPSLHSKFSFTRSSYNYQSSVVINQNNTLEEQNYFENNIDDTILKLVLEKNDISAVMSKLNFGFELNQFETLDVNRGDDNDPVLINEDGAVNSLFVKSKFTFSERLSTNIGIRTNLYSVTDDLVFEPRIFLNYFIDDNLMLKSNFGFYSQYINQQIYFDFDDIRAENLIWRLANNERLVVQSRQTMAGFIWEKQGVLIDFEGYTKKVSDLTTNNPRRSMRDPSAFVSGDLRIYGIDFLLKKNWGALDTWISYTFTSTDMDFKQLNTLSFITYYDQPHTFNITGTLPWKNWDFSLGWSYSSGIPNYFRTDFFPDPGPLEPEQGPPEPIPSESNEGRFPEQHQLDLAAVYEINSSKGWSASIGLSLLNIYDRENLIELTSFMRGQNSSIEERYGIGFAPNVMVTVSW